MSDAASDGNAAKTERPYSSTDSPPPAGRKPLGGLEPRTRFSLGYYLSLLSLFFLLQWAFFSGVDAPEMGYGEFRAKLAAGQLERLVMTEERLYVQLRAANTRAESANKGGASEASRSASSSEAFEMPAVKAPWHLGRLVDAVRSMQSDYKKERDAAEDQAKRSFTVIRLEDPGLVADLQKQGVDYRGRIESHWFENLLQNWIVPFGLLILVWGFVMRRMAGGPHVLQMGQSHAKIYEVDPSTRVQYTDLAGVDEAIEETREIVGFLRDPERFTRLGAKLPKGVLLVGPPGTGKTLLARAIAGESGVPFFSLSGSDFVEMFVGVGAARVRDLFQEAKKMAPCIVFIDELDAIGKSRGGTSPLGGGFDERENTLNQLLVEMDGFDGSAGVVILAATNRPEVLDPALLRAGRFDRRVVVDRPNRSGRTAIFKIHSRKLPLGDDIDLDALAGQTPGMVGSDIANVCNEAVLLASRDGRSQVAMEDFQEAIERSIAGPQKKSQIVTPSERLRIAYHESGHAVVGHMTPGGDPIQKISIIPRAAGALGYTLQTPLEDRYLLSKSELLDRVRVLLSGRAAEELVCGDISTGASDDLEKAGEIVRQMLTVYGMSEQVPHLSLVDRRGSGYLGRGFDQVAYSEELARGLDAEAVAILGRCYAEAKSLLESERAHLEVLAKRLLECESLDRAEVERILGERPLVASWVDIDPPPALLD